MNEQELQEFLDKIMRESAAKHKVPQRFVDDALRDAKSESAEEIAPDVPAEQPRVPVPVPEDDFPPDTVPDLGDGDADDTEDDAGEAENAENTQTIREAASASAHPLRDGIAGILLVLLAIVGILGLIQCGIFWGRQLTNAEDSRTAAIRETVLPLVLIDQADFDSPDDLTDEQFLTASVWMLIADGQLYRYPLNFEMREIPAADVTAAGNRRFGTSRKPAYKTIGFTGDLRFYYDQQTGNYLVPADPQLFTYIPEITALNDTEDGVEAEVLYRAEMPAWQAEEGMPARTVKTVVYTLTKSGEKWQVRQVHQTS